MGPRLQWVRGTMTVEATEPFSVVDPLARLPEPPDQLQLVRTWPGAPEQGVVRFSRVDEDTWSFYAILPRRYGDVGAIRRFGLFANGFWYPQVLVDDGLPTATWDVRVALPEGTLGALGDTWGTGALRWQGEGERASLAVLPGGVATPVLAVDGIGGAQVVTLLTRNEPRRVLVDELAVQLVRADLDGVPFSGVVVEAPLRRRLSRGGLGLAYVSDRAFRVSPGLRRFHRVGATRGVLEGLTPLADPFDRALVAAGLSLRHARLLAGADARGLLGHLAWIPTVDGLLHSRRMPFYAEILEDAHPGDPVRDDLVEVFDPHAPATAVALQLEDRYGPGTAEELAEALLIGLPTDRAAALADVDAAWLRSWRAPYPVQDYHLEVERDPPLVRVTRETAADAPAEAVVVAVDGERSVRVLGPGPDTAVLVPREPPRRVTLDPGRHVAQVDRVGDAWPPRYNLDLTGYLATVNLSEPYVEGSGLAYLRRRGDTHNLVTGSLYTNRDTTVGATLRYTRREGTELDGLTRPHRFVVRLDVGLLNPRFASVDGPASVGMSVQYGWSNRIATYFPVRGQRVSLSANAGYVPGTDHQWSAASAGWTAVASPHPRHAFAVHGLVSIATGDVPHRLLSLGGPRLLRSIPQNAAIGTQRHVVMGEYRVAPVRNASVPVLLGWATELQLAVGAEAGQVRLADGWASAAGVTVGVLGLAQVLGFEERAIGVTVALPVWTDGLVLERRHRPEVFLRWGQAF